MITYTPRLCRQFAAFLGALLVCMAMPPVAHAKVAVHFHSFNGSVLFGRYPHTFVVFEGVLDETGETIFENFGFSAKTSSPAVLAGPVKHIIMTEKLKYITSTNRHFSLTVDDATYRKMRAEVTAWRDAPGKYYSLSSRNCIHFVGRIAELGGLTVEYPKKLMRRPKAWLNLLTGLNSDLHAQPIN